MKQSKKGFTLIELMVVIVIIGILAAIAIPKLFGMTAKAKAQEVGPAASTWVKLQQAYMAENSRLGGNLEIGYTPPGATTSNTKTGSTGNFEYNIGEATLPAAEAAGTNPAQPAGTTGTLVFAATGSIGGDCVSGVWNVTMSANGTIDAAVGAGEDGNAAACGLLTPRFTEVKIEEQGSN